MIPLELITLVGSALMGAVMKMWAKSSDDRATAHQLAISAHASNMEAVKQAGDRGSKDKSANFAKRIIVITSTLCVSAPVWAPLFGVYSSTPISVVFGYYEFHPGFMFFTSDRDVLVWKEIISGDASATVKIVITPSMTQAFSAIIGYYLGYSVQKR